jgi:hypothetical protein
VLAARSQLENPPHGGIKRPRVKFRSFFDTCGYNQLGRSNPPRSASCRLAQERFLTNNASLNRYASLRYVSLIIES